MKRTTLQNVSNNHRKQARLESKATPSSGPLSSYLAAHPAIARQLMPSFAQSPLGIAPSLPLAAVHPSIAAQQPLPALVVPRSIAPLPAVIIQSTPEQKPSIAQSLPAAASLSSAAVLPSIAQPSLNIPQSLPIAAQKLPGPSIPLPSAAIAQQQPNDFFKEFWKNHIGEENKTCGNAFFAKILQKECKGVLPETILLITYALGGRAGKISSQLASNFFSCFGNDTLQDRLIRIQNSLFIDEPTSGEKRVAPWFYGFLKKKEVNDILQRSPAKNFIIRINHNQPGTMLLSYSSIPSPSSAAVTPLAIHHMAIHWDKNVKGFVGWFWLVDKYEGRIGPYANVADLVSYMSSSEYLNLAKASPLSIEINTTLNQTQQPSVPQISSSLFHQPPSAVSSQQAQPIQQGGVAALQRIRPASRS